MSKGLSLSGVIVAAIVLLLFGADLAIGLPFGQPSMLLDIGFVICAGVLAFISWTTYREQK